MIKNINNKNSNVAKNILELQIKSYEIEARIIDYYDLPPLKETIDNIKNSNELFYGYYIENSLVGVISYKITNQHLDIYRLVVHPDYFRRGIGEELVEYVENNNKNITKITVSTGEKNRPAINLYQKLGFAIVSTTEVDKEIYIANFEKSIP